MQEASKSCGIDLSRITSSASYKPVKHGPNVSVLLNAHMIFDKNQTHVTPISEYFIVKCVHVRLILIDILLFLN